MRNLYTVITGAALFAAAPLMVSAQLADNGNFEDLAIQILRILDWVVLIIIALALVFFLWGIAKFILNAGDPEAQATGKQVMLWGLIALFVMTAVWGLVNFLSSAVGADDDDIRTPGVPGLDN